MSLLVVVAEPQEIELIPQAFKGLPILVTGVGARALDALQNLDPKVTMIINVGYCGSKDLPVCIEELLNGPHKRDEIRHYKKLLRKRKESK